MPTPNPRRTRAAASAALLALTALGILRALPAGPRPAVAGPAHIPSTSYLPQLMSRGTVTDPMPGAQLAGIEGWGESVVEMVNQSSSEAASVDVRLQQLFENPREESLTIDPLHSAALVLQGLRRLQQGTHFGIVSSDEQIGVVGRTMWDMYGGGATGYEEAEASDALILPLSVREVFSHTTAFVIQNTDLEEENRVDFLAFEEVEGSILQSFSVNVGPGEVAEYDLIEEPLAFLPPNTVDGGFVRTLWFDGEAPIAVAAFSDERSGLGAAGFTARPQSKASTQQILPLVRANYLGDSLIAIANATVDQDAEVTITYVGDAGSPSGAGQRIEQTISIPARRSAFVDLGDRARGSVARPAVPRGARVDGGFIGHAIVSADAPVLAQVLETDGYGKDNVSAAAYNGFGPEDLGLAFSVPRVRAEPSGRRSTLVVVNPGQEALSVQVRLRDTAGAAFGGLDAAIPPGQRVVLEYEGGGDVVDGVDLAQADVSASDLVAVLVYDTARLTPAERAARVDALAYAAPKVAAGRNPDVTPSATATGAPTATPTRTPTPDGGTPPPTGGPPSTTPDPPTGTPIYLPLALRSVPVPGGAP